MAWAKGSAIYKIDLPKIARRMAFSMVPFNRGDPPPIAGGSDRPDGAGEGSPSAGVLRPELSDRARVEWVHYAELVAAAVKIRLSCEVDTDDTQVLHLEDVDKRTLGVVHVVAMIMVVTGPSESFWWDLTTSEGKQVQALQSYVLGEPNQMRAFLNFLGPLCMRVVNSILSSSIPCRACPPR